MSMRPIKHHAEKANPIGTSIVLGMFLLLLVGGAKALFRSQQQPVNPESASTLSHRLGISPTPPVPPTPPFVRPARDPDGRPFPTAPSYIIGMAKLNSDGHSSVTVDNSRSSSDVLVKIFALD